MTISHIDTFSSGLDGLTRNQQADHIAVLRVLQRAGRFSTFEATENDTIARTMDRLCHKGLVLKQPDGTKTTVGRLLTVTGGEYPWTTCELTDAGKKLLEDNPV